jgi:hypothetical protein
VTALLPNSQEMVSSRPLVSSAFISDYGELPVLIPLKGEILSSKPQDLTDVVSMRLEQRTEGET